MNIALIFAGGAGQRMNTRSMPKQFLELHEKPIIIYTLEKFDSHPEIDGIVVSCLSEWIEYLQSLVKKFNIKKVASIVPGGETGQQSIYNSILEAKRLYPEDSIVLIHDGVRPIIDRDTISRNIACARANGNSVTTSPATETIIMTDEHGEITDVIERKNCVHAKAPQCFVLKDIFAVHQKALELGITNAIDSASLMHQFGVKLNTTQGPADNMKITTSADFYAFRAILDAHENSQIFG